MTTMIVSVALFVGLISLGLIVYIFKDCLRCVPVGHLLLVRGPITKCVRYGVVGPKVVFVRPFDLTTLLDVTTRFTHCRVDELHTGDQLLAARLNILYGLDAALLQVSDLDQIYPFLGRAEDVVQESAYYLTRALATEFTAQGLLSTPALRLKFERRLSYMLQDQVKFLGIRIDGVQVLCYLPQTILQAELMATQTKISAQAQAYALRVLQAALESGRNFAPLLAKTIQQEMPNEADASEPNMLLPLLLNLDQPNGLNIHWLMTKI